MARRATNLAVDREVSEVRHVNVEGLARLPTFSHAVVAGDFIHVAGTLGTVSDRMELAEGGAGPQTAQALRNVERVLNECGATMGDIVKVNVFLSDIDSFGEMNEAYLGAMPGDPPARITVGGVDLALGAAVELDCVAYRG